MKGKALSVPAMLLAGSIAANAQTIPPGLLGTTLDYQGTYMGMTGITTTLFSGTQETGGVLPLVTSAYFGTETGSITLEEINGTPWVAYSFTLTGSPLTGNAGGNVYISGVLGSWGP